MKIDLKKILASGENQQVEFKTHFNRETIETLVAFANAEGGEVVLGVTDGGKIIGIESNPESIQNWINEVKMKTEPSLLVDAAVANNDGKSVVVLSVPEYPVKPISMQGRYFKRVNNSNHLLSATEIVNLSLLSLQMSWDSFPAHGKTIKDLNINAIKSFIKKVNDNGRLKLNGKSWLENLVKLKLVNDNQPTNAAYLLFGKGNIGYNVHAGRFKTPSFIIDDKMMNGNLFAVADETMRYLMSQIKVAYEITGITTQRTEIFEYPLPALREIVLNTIIHRDYTSPMDVQIKVFDNQITFFSPGELYGKQTVKALKTDNYQAYTRNKLIAEAFYLTGDIEKYGTGYTRIRSEISSYPTMRFEFEERPSAWLVTIGYYVQKTTEKTDFNELDYNLPTQVKSLIICLKEDILGKSEIIKLGKLEHKSREMLEKKYLIPAIKLGLVAMLYPDKPKHPKQKYYLTERGKKVLKNMK